MMGKKMPAERVAAMWQEANIGVRAQRAIHKHYNNWFGSKQLEVNNASKRNLSIKRPAGSSKKESAKKRQRQVQRSQVEEGFLLRKHKSSLAINLQEYKKKKENSSNNQSET
jgi:hypothetical protein